MPLVIVAWLGLGIPGQFSSRAAPAEEAVASPAASYTADLNHQETDEVLISRPVGIRLQTAPFQKEPALPGQNVFRGSLLWGQRTEQAMCFVWDKGRGRLLLDLNRNRDGAGAEDRLVQGQPEDAGDQPGQSDERQALPVHVCHCTARARRLEGGADLAQGGAMRVVSLTSQVVRF